MLSPEQDNKVNESFLDNNGDSSSGKYSPDSELSYVVPDVNEDLSIGSSINLSNNNKFVISTQNSVQLDTAFEPKNNSSNLSSNVSIKETDMIPSYKIELTELKLKEDELTSQLI